MQIIPFPSNCSEAIDHYRHAIRYYTAAQFLSDQVHIELGSVKFFSPMGINLLAGMVSELLRHGQTVSITYPSDRRAFQYLVDQGFLSEFPTSTGGHLDRRKNSTSIGLRRLDEFDGFYLSRVADWLHINSGLPREKVEDMVMIAMPEVINNVFDHSESPFGCYVCAQAYTTNRRLVLSVMDFGIGFLQCLKPRYPLLQGDCEAIASATQLGVSSRTTKRNAGRGLYILKEWSKERRAVLEIISREGVWSQAPLGDELTRSLSFDFPGTCINLSVAAANLTQYSASYDGGHYD